VAHLFWLYRPTAPSVRAQSIQVVNAAWAGAARGHRVTLAVQAPRDQQVTPEEVLSFYGLEPIAGLNLHVLSWRKTVAAVAFRGLFGRWLLQSRGRGIAIARSKRYALEAVRRAGGRFRLVLEAHEVDSAQMRERGGDGEATWRLEREVLAAAEAVICNAPGTLDLLRQVHPELPPAIALHNATLASRVRTPAGPGEGIGYVGSLRATKGVDALARAARAIQRPVTVIGPDRDPELERLADGWLRFEGPIPHHQVPDRLATFRTLALPLGRGLFGEQLSSPLKLWDYLASGVPIVAADTGSVREAAGDAFEPYTPGDASDLAEALTRVDGDEALRARLVGAARLRTWADRAAELDAFLSEHLR